MLLETQEFESFNVSSLVWKSDSGLSGQKKNGQGTSCNTHI